MSIKQILISTSLLFGFLLNTAYAAEGPKTPEALFKEIIKKLEANDIAGAQKHFSPTKENKDAFAKMKPAGKIRFTEGLKKAKLAKKINDKNLIYIVPYQDKKTPRLDVEITVMQMPSGYWIVSKW